MVTRYTISYRKNGWHEFAAMSDEVCMEVIGELCDSFFANHDVEVVQASDATTGEVLYERSGWDDEPSDWDREMGFDPYEGCYSFDC